MRSCLIILFAFVLALSLSLAVGPQAGQAASPSGGPAAQGGQAASGAVDVNGKNFNPRDFSGIWIRRGGDAGFGPQGTNPPLTPAGEAVIKNNVIVGRGSRHALVKNVNNPKDSNDLAIACNPKGFPRLVIDTAYDYHEVVMIPTRMIQMWQEERRPREIWLDGRPVPTDENIDNLGAAWYGHAAGRWEGNTLVVTTVGFDDRSWLDSFGFPRSFTARIEERYRMLDPDTLELQMTLHDPEYYTRDWVSDAKIWKKEPRNNLTNLGWYGLFSGRAELMCAPMNGKPNVNTRLQ
jgi:hypothetical protein